MIDIADEKKIRVIRHESVDITRAGIEGPYQTTAHYEVWREIQHNYRSSTEYVLIEYETFRDMVAQIQKAEEQKMWDLSTRGLERPTE